MLSLEQYHVAYHHLAAVTLLLFFLIHFPRYLPVFIRIEIYLWSFDIKNKQYHVHMAVSPLKHRVKRVTSAETADCIRNLQILFLKIVLMFISQNCTHLYYSS